MTLIGNEMSPNGSNLIAQAQLDILIHRKCMVVQEVEQQSGYSYLMVMCTHKQDPPPFDHFQAFQVLCICKPILFNFQKEISLTYPFASVLTFQ